MMAKIVKGSDFKGVVDYILDKNKNAQVVAYEGLFMENRETIAMSFNIQFQINGKVAKPVGHIALSFSKEDEPRLTNRVMAGIALEYMERMGIRDTQFFIARHFDKEHPHVHIAFNRIDNNGNTISDRHERLRSTRICKELTMKYGLHMAVSKDNVKRNRLKEPDKTKYELYDILKKEVGRCGNWNVLVANTGDPENYLRENWYSTSANNTAGYANKDVDAWLDELSETIDEDARKELIVKIQQAIMDDAATVFFGYENTFLISKSAVEGLVMYPMDYYWVTADMKMAE